MGKLFEMRLADDPFAKMLREEKTVEIRLYDEKRQEIKEGDEILFHRLADESNFLMTNVIALHRFNSFKELILLFVRTYECAYVFLQYLLKKLDCAILELN